MKFKSALVAVFLAVVGFATVACDQGIPTSDQQQHAQQERSNLEANKQSGFPNIVNFREKKLLKDIYELRDQANFVTYTYVFSEVSGKFTFICTSIGYGIPYATEYTNPQVSIYESNHGYITLPQADPNGLFSPATAEGTWVVCKVPDSAKVTTVYIEPRITTVPFKLPANIVINP